MINSAFPYKEDAENHANHTKAMPMVEDNL